MADMRNIVILTGAGISAESGIDTFRDAGGLWEQHKVEDVATPEAFERDPDLVLRFYDMRREAIQAKQPNAAHEALAKLDAAWDGELLIVTQNVDNLHQNSGVPDEKVIEVHGNASYAKCLNCGKRYEYEDLKPRYEADEDLTCLFCEGLLKSATISFGQAMPEDEVMLAEAAAHACDLCIAIGSSLVVYPAANIPIIAKQTGAKYVILNREPTEQDPIADLVINAEIGVTLNEALKLLT